MIIHTFATEVNLRNTEDVLYYKTVILYTRLNRTVTKYYSKRYKICISLTVISHWNRLQSTG
jgi:hypothetical protein